MKNFNIFIFPLFLLNINLNFIKSNIENQNNNNNINIHNSLNSTNYIYKKNVIIGLIQGYSLNVVLPFFESLIHADIKNCDFVIFVKDVSPFFINYLKSFRAIIYKIPEEYHNLDLMNLRWKLYKDFLKEKENEYNLVFITDIRDTLFQKDIFQYYKNNDSFIGVALEDGTLNETKNRNWIINYAGIEKHKIIQNEKIICFGTFWGTLRKVLEFSNIFWDKLKDNNNSTDQGIGNYLLYYEKIFQDILIKSDNSGPVMTIGLTERKNIILDTNNNILNFKGEVAAVVHQYDRKRDIMMKINDKFFSFYNERLNWTYIKKQIKNNKFNDIIQTFPIEENNSKFKIINTFVVDLIFFNLILMINLLIKSRRIVK